MAIRKDVDYPGRWSAATTGYPMGEPKNRTTSTSKDGSYLEKKWIQDYEAFFGALLNAAGVSPNGTVDTAEASQFFDALKSVLLGASQTWQNLLASRSQGVTYTNTTSAPIFVIIGVVTSASSSATFTIDSLSFDAGSDGSTTAPKDAVSIVVPPGSTYSVSGAVGLRSWLELR